MEPLEETTEEQAENVEEVEEDGDIQTDDDNDTEGEEDGEETGEPVELEPWEETGEEEDTEKPEKTLKAKKAWKREKKAVNEELERIKAENEALKAGRNVPQSTELKRPNPLDFDDDDAYEDAKEEYLIKKIKLEEKAAEVKRRNQELINKRKAGVGEHNERVSEFVEEKSINPDVYAQAERTFINAFEKAFPGNGEIVADDYLSKLGTGSEKIPFFFGRNKAKLAEFEGLLKEDPTGIKAAIFLGDENARLRGKTTGKPKSKAPKPAATATGDSTVKTGSQSEKALRKKYNELHSRGEGDKAWDIKVQAKKSGIDTSEWART